MERERPRPTRTAPEAPARRAAGKQQAGISFAQEVLDRIDARAKKRGLSRSGVVKIAEMAQDHSAVFPKIVVQNT